MAKARTTRRPDGIEAVYLSTHAYAYPDSSDALIELETFEEWVAHGCPSRLDYSPEERAVVDTFLASCSS